MKNKNTGVRVITCDGGGARGAFTASVLDELEKLLPGYIETADVLGGTSSGAIIMSYCAFFQNGAQSVLPTFRDNLAGIFRAQPLSMLGAMGSKYSSEFLKSLLTSLYGDCKLGEVRKHLVITASDMYSGEAVIFDSHNPNQAELRLVDVVMASAAAPMFFDPVEMNGRLYADGGMWAVDPSLATLYVLRQRGFSVEEVKLLNIGTGVTNKVYTESRSLTGWGALGGWKGTKMVNLTNGLNSNAITLYLDTILHNKQYVDIDCNLEKVTEIDDLKAVKGLISKGKQAAKKYKDTVAVLFDSPSKVNSTHI